MIFETSESHARVRTYSCLLSQVTRARDVYGLNLLDIPSHADKIPLLGTFRLEGGGKTMQTLCMEIHPNQGARENCFHSISEL